MSVCRIPHSYNRIGSSSGIWWDGFIHTFHTVVSKLTNRKITVQILGRFRICWQMTFHYLRVRHSECSLHHKVQNAPQRVLFSRAKVRHRWKLTSKWIHHMVQYIQCNIPRPNIVTVIIRTKGKMKDGMSNKGNIGTIDIIDGILKRYPMIRRKCYLGVRFVSLASRNSGTRTILYLLLDYLQVRHRRRPPGDHEVQNTHTSQMEMRAYMWTNPPQLSLLVSYRSMMIMRQKERRKTG